ncbi:four-helix bundle copper-binding protein [Arthrobacter sp. ISL-72]|uniref:four-helix bundle copper-binding protein n=1 Tax=Arthrobacter sp. ISL-72 TaxID=2819114 RepID=UPI001BEC1A1C|nr:four-helix bundle copper-binding protein [Arthrobacter sp. ISL-72]MBT2597252.1 four-helix bundle copper-binding protein [Arthrobacter sp. ISL-72]
MTHYITAMLNAHPGGTGSEDKEKLAACIAACFECSQTCTACADSCLAEDMVADLARCIRTDLDCADICAVTGTVLTRQTGDSSAIIRSLLEACRSACAVCAAECEQHAQMHEHCRICAEACRRCEIACTTLLESLS